MEKQLAIHLSTAEQREAHVPRSIVTQPKQSAVCSSRRMSIDRYLGIIRKVIIFGNAT